MRKIRYIAVAFSAIILAATFSSIAPASATTFTCGSGTYTITAGVVDNGQSCTGDVTIDSSANSIAVYAFYPNNAITSIVIPSGVTTIGESAFFFVGSLRSVTIENGLTYIGNYAFAFTGITSISLPSSLRTLDGYVFYGSTLTSLVIPEGTTTVADYSLFSAYSLTTVTVPNTVTSMGLYTFYNSPITTINYCGTNSSVLAAIAQQGVVATCSGSTPAPSAGASVVPSATPSPTPTPTKVLAPATIDSLTFKDDGTGTGGKLSWTGKLIDSVLYEGPASTFPGAFSYGSYNSSWNGNLVNLTPDTEYTFKLSVISKDGVGTSKSITVKTEKAGLVVRDLAYWSNWLAENTYVSGEAANIYNLLAKFDALKPGTSSTTLKIPTSRVSTASAKSNTPSVCVMSDAATIKSIAKGTCTISYTVVGKSKAPATLVKSFTFKKFAK
jgi:hypothetical protein